MSNFIEKRLNQLNDLDPKVKSAWTSDCIVDDSCMRSGSLIIEQSVVDFCRQYWQY